MDLRDHIVLQAGVWVEDEASNRRADRLVLANEGDRVALAGFVRVRVGLELQNVTIPTRALPAGELGAGFDPCAITDIDLGRHFHEVDSYVLTVSAGQTWVYTLSMRDVHDKLGSNCGYRVVIRPAGPDAAAPATMKAADLPCDFATADIPDTGRFFPAGCEPCPPDASIGLPPGCGTTLAVPAAPGGCVRPRFFNGMLITREDMESELLYVRLKDRLHNRASGAGVVWGLGVGRVGDALCVQPGYAVDCCGNDLTVTTPYRVPIRSLLCDPAAAASLGSGASRGRCLHLLLEYAECPEQPRPVHGDVCSPQTTRCEMARIRETVRLRLVPPRRLDTSGPIADFLDELETLRKDPDLAPFFPKPAPSGGGAPTGPPPALLPFRVEVEVTQSNHPQAPNTINLQARTDDPAEGSLALFEIKITRLRVLAEPGIAFSAGDAFLTVGPDGPVNPPTKLTTAPPTFTRLEWNTDLFGVPQDARQAERRYRFQTWKLAPSDGGGPQLVGSTEIQLLLRPFFRDEGTTLDLQMIVLPSAVEVVPTAPPGPRPCLGDPCCPDEGPLFPTIPPFVHADPLRKGQPADPKAIALAVLYGWLAMQAAPTKGGTSDAVLKQAAQLYQLAWLGIFGISTKADKARFSEALRRLLAAWCRHFLYPGPRCEGEPHGVVIGCVRVVGGDIREVDPHGGRRYVVHSPLLAYWGGLFGLTPVDVLASRLASLTCCIAGLPLPVERAPEGGLRPIGVVVLPEQPREREGVVDLAGSFVLRAAPEEVEGRLAAMKVRPVRTVTISPAEFVGRVLSGLRRPPAPPEPDAPLVRYTVAGMPDVHLLVPDPEAPTGVQRPAPDRSRLTGLVRAAVVGRPERDAVPPLLREFTERLGAGLLDALPLASIPHTEGPAREPLVKAGYATAGAVLAASPEVLHEDVLGRAEAVSLGGLLSASEAAARAVTGAASDLVVKYQRDKRLSARDDLRSGDLRKTFADDLAKALAGAKLPVPPPAVLAAVTDAAGVEARRS